MKEEEEEEEEEEEKEEAGARALLEAPFSAPGKRRGAVAVAMRRRVGGGAGKGNCAEGGGFAQHRSFDADCQRQLRCPAPPPPPQVLLTLGHLSIRPGGADQEDRATSASWASAGIWKAFTDTPNSGPERPGLRRPAGHLARGVKRARHGGTEERNGQERGGGRKSKTGDGCASHSAPWCSWGTAACNRLPGPVPSGEERGGGGSNAGRRGLRLDIGKRPGNIKDRLICHGESNNNNYSIKEEDWGEEDKTPTGEGPNSVFFSFPSLSSSAPAPQGTPLSLLPPPPPRSPSLTLGHCSMSALVARQEDEDFCILGERGDFEAFTDTDTPDGERPGSRQLRTTSTGLCSEPDTEDEEEMEEEEEEEEEQGEAVPFTALVFLAQLVYGYLVCPVPPYVCAVVHGAVAGVVLAGLALWLSSPGRRSPAERRRRRGIERWNVAQLDIQEPGIFKVRAEKWMVMVSRERERCTWSLGPGLLLLLLLPRLAITHHTAQASTPGEGGGEEREDEGRKGRGEERERGRRPEEDPSEPTT
ncbi:hypothetical protein CRUP_007449 [Coryphaenoides rupestris]|nr:hypothetical protein CRUP_007449 [Coryphaenoides rupestris]